MEFYLKYRESRPAEEFDPVLRAEAERKEAERRRLARSLSWTLASTRQTT